MPSDYFACGCKGTVHDPRCQQARTYVQRQPVTYSSTTETFEDIVLRRLERIIELLEEIAGRRR